MLYLDNNERMNNH